MGKRERGKQSRYDTEKYFCSDPPLSRYEYGYEASLKAMEMAVKNGNVNKSDVTVLAARITGYGIETPPENGPNLSIYDELFIYGQNTLSREVHAS